MCLVRYTNNSFGFSNAGKRCTRARLPEVLATVENCTSTSAFYLRRTQSERGEEYGEEEEGKSKSKFPSTNIPLFKYYSKCQRVLWKTCQETLFLRNRIHRNGTGNSIHGMEDCQLKYRSKLKKEQNPPISHDIRQCNIWGEKCLSQNCLRGGGGAQWRIYWKSNLVVMILAFSLFLLFQSKVQLYLAPSVGVC